MGDEQNKQQVQSQEKPNGNGRQLPNRYDGVAKVTGRAKYAAEFYQPGMLYAVMLQSTIASGEILKMETQDAENAPGVVKVLTPFNAPQLPAVKAQPPALRHLSLLQDRTVYYNGEPIAVVVAKSLVEAQYAASLVKVKYRETPSKLNFEKRLSDGHEPKGANAPTHLGVGNADSAWSKATVVLEQTYSTPLQNHNPMEPHATIAKWDGEKVTVWDATQYISGARQTIAKQFSLPQENVHVLDPYVGGGFGSKGSTWSHVMLCCMAAKVVGAPVQLVLERPQMFGPVGGRAATVQHIKLGTDDHGKLVAMEHHVTLPSSLKEAFLESAAQQTQMLYECDTIQTGYSMVDMNIGVQTFMRAPGEAPGTAALESAMDELAEKLKMDPLELRLVNYAEVDRGLETRDFSSKNLKQAYSQAAERFGWARRNRTPGQLREGNLLIGHGMATATYPANRSAAMAKVRLNPDASVWVGSGTQDLGTGMYTIMAQTVMQELDVPYEKVTAELGDSTLPKAPVSGGSQSTASVGPAVKEACHQLLLKLAANAVSDASSPLHGAQTSAIECKGGTLRLKSDPSKSESLSASIARNQGQAVEAEGSAEPSQEAQKSLATHSWGAVFAEVAVDQSTYMVKVRRIVATYDIGLLLNHKTGISQLEGGLIWGIGMALTEGSWLDNNVGRIVNENLAEYHVPCNADAPQMDITALNIADTRFNPQGARGIGEIGITGVAGAIANAIYNATGRRVRDFPITLDRIMSA